MARQIRHLDPGKNQIAAVVDHPRQVLQPLPILPPDPPVPGGERLGRPAQHNTPQPMRAGLDEVALAIPERPLVAQRVIALQIAVAQGPRLLIDKRNQLDRTLLGQRHRHRGRSLGG